MKETLNLTLRNNGDFQDYETPNGAGFVCSEFVEYFLNTHCAPFEIIFTYVDKSPKEKGFKKVRITENTEDDGYPYKIFVSGKFYKKVSLFYALENKLSLKTENIFWVKIEDIN